MSMSHLWAAVLCLSVLVGCSTDDAKSTSESKHQHADSHSKNIQLWPKVKSPIKSDPALEAMINDRYLAKMSIEAKVAQIIQPEIRSISPEQFAEYRFGSILNGGGAFPQNNKHASVADWVALADAYYEASKAGPNAEIAIPAIWGTDAVHGHNNVIGATLFPHNIGLGATHNAELIKQIAAATAQEVAATGIDWVFAPTVAVVRDDRWGRTYEGFSEDPELVTAYAKAYVNGMQGKVDAEDFLRDGHVIGTAKHFLGDGGTDKGDDQGNNLASEDALIRLHAQGYVAAMEAGVQTIMASFNSWHGLKMHGNDYLLTEVLKNRMGFDGFVVGDWNGHGQVDGCTNTSCAASINAGVDMIMVPDDWQGMYENTVAQVKSGEISMARLDDAVRRILRVKIRAGLFDDVGAPSTRAYAGKAEVLASEAHREIARQAVRESLVLLKNKGGLLPISPTANILVAGDGADNIGKQSGGWTITWQGTGNTNADFPNGSSIYAGLAAKVEQAGGKITLSADGSFGQKPDVAIVVYGENPYAEGQGDLGSLEYQVNSHSDLALLKKLKAAGIPVVSVFLTGRPLWINPELNASDAFVVAWLPGSEGGAVADVLLRDSAGKVQTDFSGKLSYSWPAHEYQLANRGDKQTPLFAYGYGLNYRTTDKTAYPLPEERQTNLGDADRGVDLFRGRALPPWEMTLISGTQSKPMDSSVVTLDGLTVRTSDRKVQEDARELSWQVGSTASFALTAEKMQDLAVNLSNNSSLFFDLKLQTKAPKNVLLGMTCGGTCGGNLLLDSLLAPLSTGEWHTVEIDLQCLNLAGVEFYHIDSPFRLTSQGDAKSLHLSNIRISAKSGTPLTCPGE
ncbi:glycoside hydrolase family 3 N-terminal domain-containing protein [Teredinibacter turnerae]|uniref:glycoside hydrolase family 3 protein n=1 Tax=Teredinibacter turnerae TaxID=2426 RepID=UPI000370C1F7|nr:glycoside hydrolase family 3 protein [Teredinibacter turnerae]